MTTASKTFCAAGRQVARPLAGRDDRVVIAHLGVVDDPPGEGAGRCRSSLPISAGLSGLQVRQDAGDLALHVVAQVPRVGPRVADQLVLVERLGRLERGVGRHPVPPVHVPLQLGQVVQLGRRDPLRLPLDAPDRRTDGPGRAASSAWASSSLAKRSPANLKVTSRYRVSSSQNGSGLNVRISSSRRTIIARTGVCTRPTLQRMPPARWLTV